MISDIVPTIMSTEEQYKMLEDLLPIINSFRYGECCEASRQYKMIIALKDLFPLMNVKVDELDLLNRPFVYYDILYKLVNSLPFTEHRKLKLRSILDKNKDKYKDEVK
jgi:hypothetical protein